VTEAERARVEPPVVLEGPLRVLDRLMQRVDRASSAIFPEALNPLAQTGAIANTSLIVAVVSGVVLLVWYSSSVHLARDSMATMGALGQFVRALHRYSSDACMLFVLVHALQIGLQRRFGGARWLAWVTGAMLVSTLWLVGWLGYWLTWDERARQVALGTARVLDPLPIFTDPLSRSFLTDETVGSLLFFVVFFFHMLIPLAMGIALWLHITRLSRPSYLTSKRMTPWVIGTLALLSIVRPADLAGPAHMAEVPRHFAIDAWYLAPMWLTDRLGGGLLWTLLLAGAVAAYSIPWALARKRAEPARVIEPKCNACERCVADCPYDAIRMVPRKDATHLPMVASVDPSKCIGCGICAGSCDSAGIGLPWFDVVKKRAEMDHDLDRSPKPVAFVCAESADLDLPGWRVTRVPCAGWVHALTVERAIRHGADQVLVVGCGPGACMYREGPKWAKARMSGEREPMLDLQKVDPKKVRVLELYPHQRPSEPPRKHAVWGIALALAIGALVWAGSRVSYALPSSDRPELVVSFKHPGMVGEACRDLTEAEKKKTPPHMRPPKICERKRVPVRMRAFVDDVVVVDRAYAPSGLWSDGNSLALERIPIDAGEHRVRVEIGDTPDESAWPYASEESLVFVPRAAHVVRFDKVDGFSWK
jgi:ferredoxin